MATLAKGLSDNSRTKMKLNGQRLTLEQSLMAITVDLLGAILRQRSRHKTKLKSIYKALTEPPKPKDELKKFATAEDFEAWYKKKHVRC